MNIQSLIQEMHDAQTEETKEKVLEKIKSRFDALSDLEKEEVRKTFSTLLDEELESAKKKLEEIDRKIEMMENTKFASTQIA